jgi:hypothetical protein
MAIKKFGAAIGRAAGHGLAIGRRLIYERTILALTAIFCVAVAATLWHFSRLSLTLVRSSALQGTSIYSQTITELRTFYNSEVVERVRSRGVEVTHDYATKDGAIPIPATFTIEFGKHIGEKNAGMQIRLYSDYPFPFRKEGGAKDDFDERGLDHSVDRVGAHTGITPCFFLGRSSFLFRKISNARINRRRVSAGWTAAWANCFSSASKGPLKRSPYSSSFLRRVFSGSFDCSISFL